ncbi:MAG: DUF4157 domain-containing protein [Kofleriaceae bacterium]
MLGHEERSSVAGVSAEPTDAAPVNDNTTASPWWETAASDYIPIVAVDPALYGIESESDEDRESAIADGTSTPGTSLPFLGQLQSAFGPRHDLSAALAHTGETATTATDDMNANAFATGSHVVFGGSPDLWTAAHEATHLVQQSAGIRPAGGIGAADDEHEQKADAVADLVVSGGSAQALLADYAPFMGQAAPAGPIMQLDRRADTSAPPAPTKVSDAGAFAFLKDGEAGILDFEQGVQRANLLYDVVKSQAGMKATHEQVDANYKEVSKQRDKMLEVSTFEKIIGGVTAVVDFATSISGIVSAARTLHAAAALRSLDKKTIAGKTGPGDNLRAAKLRAGQRGKSKLKAVGDLVKDGVDVGKTVAKLGTDDSDPDAKLDTETMLPNANAAAIQAGNDALIDWVNSATAMDFQILQESGANAAQKFHHMAEGVALLVNDGTPLSDQSFERYKSIIERFDAARLKYIAAVDRVRSILRAYDAGGSAGLANARELSVFETIQEWKAKNDPRAASLRFALDQDAKAIHFTGTHIDLEAPLGGGAVTHYHCHQYEERHYRSEDATLYVSDGPAAGELMKLGLTLPSPSRHGEAEKAEDKPGSGTKLAISASIAKAIESLGVPGTSNDARVSFHAGGVGSVSNKHKGPWFDNWRSTAEFAAFWKTHLGGQYAYLMSSDGKRQTIPAATGDAAVMDRSAVMHPVMGGVL